MGVYGPSKGHTLRRRGTIHLQVEDTGDQVDWNIGLQENY